MKCTYCSTPAIAIIAVDQDATLHINGVCDNHVGTAVAHCIQGDLRYDMKKL